MKYGKFIDDLETEECDTFSEDEKDDQIYDEFESDSEINYNR